MDKETAGRRRHGPTICSKAKEIPILLEILMTRRQRAYIIEPVEYSCTETLYLPYFLSSEN